MQLQPLVRLDLHLHPLLIEPRGERAQVKRAVHEDEVTPLDGLCSRLRGRAENDHGVEVGPVPALIDGQVEGGEDGGPFSGLMKLSVPGGIADGDESFVVRIRSPPLR